MKLEFQVRWLGLLIQAQSGNPLLPRLDTLDGGSRYGPDKLPSPVRSTHSALGFPAHREENAAFASFVQPSEFAYLPVFL